MRSPTDRTLRLAAEGLALGLMAAAVYSVQKFLFPLEDYWLGLLSGLLGYALVHWLLIDRRLTANLFTALDQGRPRVVDALWLFVGPPLISGALAAAGRGLFVFLLPTLWVMCLLQSCLSSILETSLFFLRDSDAAGRSVRIRAWLLNILALAVLFALAFLSGGIGKPVYSLLSGDAAVRGLWFTIPVPKSESFPAGHGRLEDSVFDDLGPVFAAELGQTLGLVKACDVPGPVTGLSVQARIPSPLVQPRFNYAVESMCSNWLVTLPGFFWKIGLLGFLLLALVIGIHGFGDPLDFGILSVVFLFQWISWPLPATIRMGNVAVLIAGAALLASIVPLFRRERYSSLVIWGITAGVMFGLAAFVRRPVGLALVGAASVVLLLLGIRRRRMILALTAVLALWVGSSLVPAMANGLFHYRDTQLHISAPTISPRAHGSGVPLLGGVGGQPVMTASGVVPQYDNALDVAFLDAAIWYVVYDRNPMIGFSQRSFSLLQDAGQQLFLQYVRRHPLEFGLTVLQKVGATTQQAAAVLLHRPLALLLLVVLLALRHLVFRGRVRRADFSARRVLELLLALTLLLVFAAIPAVLTAPEYGESYQLPAAVLFVMLAVAVDYASLALGSRSVRS